MGMVLSLTSLSDATIRRVLDHPPLVWHVIAPDDPEAYERSRQEKIRRPGLLGRLFGQKAAEPPVSAPVETLQLAENEGDVGYLDKAWHGIHYLLTGSDWGGSPPLDFLVAGGDAVGHEDTGYGPPRAFMAAQVREIVQALDAVTDDELRARFAPEDMAQKEIYPSIWSDEDEEESLDYLMEHVAELRTALATAVERGHGLLIRVS